MKGFEGFINNVVTINQKNLFLKNNIISIQVTTDKIYILTEISSKNESYHSSDVDTKIEIIKNDTDSLQKIYDEINNSVYCYDYSGKLLWTAIMAKKFQETSQFIPAGIVGIQYDKSECKFYLFDYIERRYEVDKETGKVLNFSIPRNNPKIFKAL